jgi:hypothetical protein
MSELRIGLVAEGITDQIVIEAALRAMLPQAFVLTLLQPEPTHANRGNGWCGVFKWCQDLRSRGYAGLADDPTLDLFDLVILHLDADVAEKSYADCGTEVEEAAAVLPSLPCAQPCPPPEATVATLRGLLLAWLGVHQEDAKTLFCMPSKATESWLAVAILPDLHPLLDGIECKSGLAASLSQLPKDQRIKNKSARDYRVHEQAITSGWAKVCSKCAQARAFHEAVTAAALCASSKKVWAQS